MTPLHSLATSKGHAGVPAPPPGALGRPGSAKGARPGLGREWDVLSPQRRAHPAVWRARRGGPGGLGRPGSREPPTVPPARDPVNPGAVGPKAVASRRRPGQRRPGVAASQSETPETLSDARDRNRASPPTPSLELCNYPIIRGSRGGRDARRWRLMHSRCRGSVGTWSWRGEAGNERLALGSPHWSTRPGLPHTAHPGRTRHAGAAASNAVLWTAKAFGAPPLRGDQRLLRGLAARPGLPFCVCFRLGLPPALGDRRQWQWQWEA